MVSKRKSIAAKAAALMCCMAVAVPGSAIARTNASEAEDIRSLSIMLMVTSLRCRMTEHDFRGEYQRFNTAHRNSLNGAGRTLQSELVARYGSRGSKRELDRISVQIANSYGDGHPWLGCAELKQITNELSSHGDHVQLSAAARKLLGSGPAPVMAMQDSRRSDLAMAEVP